MYELFEKQRNNERARQTFPKFDYVKDRMTEDANKVIAFTRRFPGFVHSDNYIASFINSITVPFNGNMGHYANMVGDAAMRLSRTVGMVSSINQGRVYTKGYFGRRDTSEIVIAVDTDFDLSDLKDRWMDLRPIRYLHHETTDITFPILFGKDSRYGKDIPDIGYTVIEVNVTMLMVQYQYWIMSTESQQQGEHQSIAQFAKMYPLVNAIWSYTDIAIFNRLKELTYKLNPIPVSNNYHNYAINDVGGKLDTALKEMVEYLSKTRLDFISVFRCIPMLSAPNLWEALEPPSTAPTRQVEWALSIARLPAVAWYLVIAELSESHSSNDYRGTIRKAVQHFKNDGTFKNALDPLASLAVSEYINDYITIALK